MPEDRAHPLTWPLVVGMGGLILGVGGSVVWVGGALRQIDINTKRLETLEQFGSPIVQAIKADLQSMRVTLTEATRQSEHSAEINVQQAQQIAKMIEAIENLQRLAAKTEDVILERGKLLAAHEEAIKQLTADIRTLEQFSRDTSERRAAIVAQVSATEGRLAANEKAMAEMSTTFRRLRDDLASHVHEDEQRLRDEVNQWRERGLRPMTKSGGDEK